MQDADLFLKAIVIKNGPITISDTDLPKAKKVVINRFNDSKNKCVVLSIDGQLCTDGKEHDWKAIEGSFYFPSYKCTKCKKEFTDASV